MDSDNDECEYRIHVNMNDDLDGCSYFLKVMLGDFSERLRIPAAFSQKLRKETGEDMVLQGSSAQQWVVKLWGANSHLEFRQGWGNFVGDHAIESGDFVTFKYVCRCYFKVRVFGKNGCEKKTIISSESEDSDKRYSDSDTATATATATQLRTSSDFEEELNDQREAKVSRMRKQFKFSSRGLAVGRQCHKPSLAGRKEETVKPEETQRNSCQESKFCHLPRRCRNAGERNKAIQAAYSFTSIQPFCLVNISASHVKRYWLNLPNFTEERLKLPKEMRVVFLLNSDGEEWRVRYNWSDIKNVGAFGAGWRQFSVENNLQKGDICIFERIDKGNSNAIIKLRVHIFRAAEESSNSEGGISNDGLEIPTSHSNKKMKTSREDPSTNLPAKRGRPKQGKQGAKRGRPKKGEQGAKHCLSEQGKQGPNHGEKQMEEKKKKIYSTSTHLKKTGSKCITSISDGKAGYRRSLRFTKRCNLINPRKKGVLGLPSSSFARDTVELSDETIPLDDTNGEEEITSVDDMNVEEEEEMMIVLDSNVEHVMATQSESLNPSQGNFMRTSSYRKMKSKGQASNLVVEL